MTNSGHGLDLEDAIHSGETNRLSFPQIAAAVTQLARLDPDATAEHIQSWHITYQQAVAEAHAAYLQGEKPLADAIRQHAQYARLVRDLFLDATTLL